MRFIAGLADDAPNPKIIGERRIGFGSAYVGCLTHYAGGLGWTHSLQRFGTAAFASPDLAEADFWAAKERLPASTHKAIFGYEHRPV